VNVPSSLVSGAQYFCVSFIGPLWLRRAGRRCGVHFLEEVEGWRDSIAVSESVQLRDVVSTGLWSRCDVVLLIVFFARVLQTRCSVRTR
jgi:hypothetical protein